MPDVGQGCSCAADAREREVFASCRRNRNGDTARAAKTHRAAALLRTLVMTFAVAATAGCAMPAGRNNAQPPSQQTCNVAGKFCDTFFGP
jgi:hypothetical protein